MYKIQGMLAQIAYNKQPILGDSTILSNANRAECLFTIISKNSNRT